MDIQVAGFRLEVDGICGTYFQTFAAFRAMFGGFDHVERVRHGPRGRFIDDLTCAQTQLKTAGTDLRANLRTASAVGAEGWVDELRVLYKLDTKVACLALTAHKIGGSEQGDIWMAVVVE